MFDIRRILIVFVVGILFTVLVFSTIQAVYPSPSYTDYCRERLVKPYPLERNECPDIISQTELNECSDKKGTPEYTYNANNCPISFECSMCNKQYQDSREKHDFWNFIISAIFGLVGVLIGMNLPVKKNKVHEWIGSGLMLGGLISIFIGTAMHYGDLHRWIRPIVILLELILVIWLSYNKLAPKK